MAEQRLRQGLPRQPGGQPWPAEGAVAQFPVVLPELSVSAPVAGLATSGSVRRGLPRVAGGPPWPPDLDVQFAVVAPQTGSTAPLKAADNLLRRGLPRVAGGSGWPPAGATADFAVTLPAGGQTDVRLEYDLSGFGTPEGQVIAEATDQLVPAPSQPAKTAATAIRWRRTVIWVGAIFIVAVAAVVFAAWFCGSPSGVQFIAAYPGTTPLPDWVPQGIPAWLGWQHFLNAFFMVMLVRAALIVRSGDRPAAMWRRRHPRPDSKPIQIELWTHLSLDLLWITNGVIFVVLLFVTGQWARIVPLSWDVVPNAVSAGLQYLSLHLPNENGWVAYNSLQVLGYFVTSFVAAPLAAITGLRMSPLWPTRWDRLSRVYTIEGAKRVHFPVMVYFVAFCVVHVGLVLVSGPLRNLSYMYAASQSPTWWGVGLFAASLVVMIGGWFVIRPALMKFAGSLFGKVGRS